MAVGGLVGRGRTGVVRSGPHPRVAPPRVKLLALQRSWFTLMFTETFDASLLTKWVSPVLDAGIRFVAATEESAATGKAIAATSAAAAAAAQ